MSENELNVFTKAELLAAAEEFGVEVKPSQSKGDIINAFEADGVTKAIIDGFRPAEAEAVAEDEESPVAEPEAEEEEDLVLVKMIRTNGTYQIRGYTFKRDHPFALVKESIADFLVEEHEGFRMASPKEAKEYYS